MKERSLKKLQAPPAAQSRFKPSDSLLVSGNREAVIEWVSEASRLNPLIWRVIPPLEFPLLAARSWLGAACARSTLPSSKAIRIGVGRGAATPVGVVTISCVCPDATITISPGSSSRGATCQRRDRAQKNDLFFHITCSLCFSIPTPFMSYPM